VGIQEILEKYSQSETVQSLTKALQSKNPKIQLKGLIGSSDAFIAVSSYNLQERPMVFILPTHEDASYFLSDLESLLDKQVLFFPSSYRKAFDFTQTDSANVLQRAETLSSLNHTSELPKMVVTYPEAIAEKVINRNDLDKNTLEITENTALSIDFINEFLIEYDFERVDFVYEPGQFAIRGGIVDIFSFSNDLPYRIEFFGDDIESIRTFDIESQLSVKNVCQKNPQSNHCPKCSSEIPDIPTHFTIGICRSGRYNLDQRRSIYVRYCERWVKESGKIMGGINR